MSDKESIIAKSYYDLAGFSSAAQHLADARKLDKTITMQDIKDWRAKNIEVKKQLRGSNSFVAQHPYQEYQADLIFMDKDYEPKYTIAISIIDIFSKYATVIPISSKQPGDVLAGLIEGFDKMSKKPKILFTDNEGSFNSNLVKEYCKDHNIEQLFTNNHAAFVERFTRSFKDMIYKRVEALKKPWTEFINPVLVTYNYKNAHSSTGKTPNEARKPENDIDVKLNLESRAKKTREYPEIEIGDKVKIFKKKTLAQKRKEILCGVQTLTKWKIS